VDLQLQDKVVVISGGANGIGKAIAAVRARERAIPVILDRDDDAGQNVAVTLKTQGGSAHFLLTDMTQETAISESVHEILDTLGRIDVVINNVGNNDTVGLRAGVDAFANSVENNLIHSYALVHHTLDALIESRGSIVNIGSKVADTGQGNTSGYAAAKGGINALTREWAVDLAPHSIRVNCVAPADAMTELYQRWLNTLSNPKEALDRVQNSIPFANRLTTLEEIADTVAFIASPRSSHTTGQILHVDGGYVHLDRRCGQTRSHT